MRKLHSSFCLLVVLFIGKLTIAQSKDEKAILQLLNEQTVSWNKGNIDLFMTGYWNNDSLMFIAKNGITYGYQNTLNNYKRNYSDTIKMGTLTFNIIKVQRLSKQYAYVVGKWFLKRSIGDLSGHYTLLFRKMNGKWFIIADHTS
jgi:hypothetical protein